MCPDGGLNLQPTQLPSRTTSPFITSIVGSPDAEAEQEERLSGFTFSALTAEKTSVQDLYWLHIPIQPHRSKVSLAMDGRKASRI